MTTEIKVPTLGESVSEATVGQWFKKEGDAVKQDEPLLELETDKVTVEVPAPVSGRLESISVKDGETVGVGAVLGMLAEGATGTAAPIAAGPEAPKERASPKAEAKSGNGEAKAAEAPKKTAKESAMPPAPSAQKLMAEKNVDASSV